jgi:hypothetical protein
MYSAAPVILDMQIRPCSLKGLALGVDYPNPTHPRN